MAKSVNYGLVNSTLSMNLLIIQNHENSASYAQTLLSTHSAIAQQYSNANQEMAVFGNKAMRI